MAEAIFDGTCQINPDEKDDLDTPATEQNILKTPKENHSKNRLDMV